ncbi:response regulator receiver protein [Burkholderiales bacterium GJ-E10]|nr:response regulator receiver protein [Burkholderiales bacterium GJ-E10]
MQIGVDAQRAVENRRVFVIDESEIDRAALQFMLADENETHEFASVQAALEKGEAWPPDLALIGTSVTGKGGAALLHRLRATWPGIKILVVSETADIAGIAAAKAAGADDALARPFKLETVRRKVDRLLGRPVELRISVVER